MSNVASFKAANLTNPANGSLAIPYRFDFDAATSYTVDLTQQVDFQQIGVVQSVFIDNADNSAVFDLTLYGAQYPQRIRANAYSQGWYPLTFPIGSIKMLGASQGGVSVDVILANYAMPYITWGPQDGAQTVPPLTNVALNALNFGGAGDNQLVAGVGLQTIKLYRGIFSVDSPAVLTWTDGAGGTVLFAAQLTAGGSVTFQASGINWFNTTAGNDLTLHSSAACNVYGGFGYVQS